MRRTSFQVKLSVVFIVVLVFVLTLTTFFIFQRAVLQQKEELRLKILSLAKVASLLIDADRHSQIRPEIESQNTAPYKEIKAVLEKIRDADPLIDSVYTMVKTDTKNIWMFVVDSGEGKSGVAAYCGERYDVSRFPQMQLAFEGSSVDRELTQDKWGVWLSSYAPIYNRQGEAIAIVGLDVSAESIRKMQLLLARRFLRILGAVVIFSLFLGWWVARNITRPLRSLIRGVREVGRGNLMQKVNVSSGDELEELGDDFNKMTDELLDAQSKLHRNYLNTIKSLAQALEAKDPYTRGHSERVTRYAINMAKHLGLRDAEIRLLEEVCVLHDIGKIGVPEKILSKPGALSQEEWEAIKKHPEIGEEILKPIEFLKPGLSIVHDHHERPDGKGYPRALKADEISLLARIVKVADAFDAMTSERPYRRALSEKESLKILIDNKGTEFDARVVDVFVDLLKL